VSRIAQTRKSLHPSFFPKGEAGVRARALRQGARRGDPRDVEGEQGGGAQIAKGIVQVHTGAKLQRPRGGLTKRIRHRPGRAQTVARRVSGGVVQQLADRAGHTSKATPIPGLGEEVHGGIAGQQMEQQGSRGVEVRFGTDAVSADPLLRGHEGQAAHGQSRSGQPQVLGERDAKVREPDAGLGEQDVSGLDVPVDEAGIVHHGQRIQDRKCQLDRAGRRQRTSAHRAREALIRQLHDDEALRLGAGVQDLHDVRVVQRLHHQGFAHEASGEVGHDRIRPGFDDLQSDLAPIAHVRGGVHVGHAARAESPTNLVAVR
jgi:hypothetical protein